MLCTNIKKKEKLPEYSSQQNPVTDVGYFAWFHLTQKVEQIKMETLEQALAGPVGNSPLPNECPHAEAAAIPLHGN